MYMIYIYMYVYLFYITFSRNISNKIRYILNTPNWMPFHVPYHHPYINAMKWRCPPYVSNYNFSGQFFPCHRHSSLHSMRSLLEKKAAWQFVATMYSKMNKMILEANLQKWVDTLGSPKVFKTNQFFTVESCNPSVSEVKSVESTNMPVMSIHWVKSTSSSSNWLKLVWGLSLIGRFSRLYIFSF